MTKHLIILAYFLLPVSVFSQHSDLEKTLDELAKNIQTVETKKYTYEQSITQDKSKPYFIRLEIIRTDSKDKGSSLVQYINLKDIDAKSIQRKNAKDILFIRASTKAKKKYIKNIKDGKLDKYGNEIEIVVQDADNSRAISGLLIKAMDFAEKIPVQTKIPNTLSEQINWLAENIKNGHKENKAIHHKLTKEDKYNARLILESSYDGKKGNTKEQFAFNLIDLNNKKISFKIDKEDLYVLLETKDNRKYIRYHKNGELGNYTKSLKIYVDDIETGIQISDVFQKATIISQKQYKKSIAPSICSLIQSAPDNDGNNAYFQEADITDCILSIQIKYEKKGKLVTEQSKVHLADLDPKSIKNVVSKKEIWILIPVLKKKKLIQRILNDGDSEFLNELKIKLNDIETARSLLESFPAYIEKCSGKNECKLSSNQAIAQMDEVAKILGTITIGSVTYEQTLQPIEGNNDKWEYSRIENKKKSSKEEKFVFNINDLNDKNLKFKAGKKALSIIISTSNNEKIIKYFVDEKPDDYENQMEWLFDDVQTMRAALCILQHVIEKSKSHSSSN